MREKAGTASAPVLWCIVGDKSRAHVRLADTSRRCARSICTACFVVGRPRRAADTSTNQRPHGFLCRRTASMEHAADTADIGADSTGATGNFAPVLTQELGQTLRFALGTFHGGALIFKVNVAALLAKFD